MGRLGHTGASTALRRRLFPAGFGAEVMRLISETWRTFAPHRGLRLEDRITAVFRLALIDAYVAAGRTWFITQEDPIVDPTYGTQEGRNDMNFYPAHHHGQKVFFTVECKRLHVSRPPTIEAQLKAMTAGKRKPKPTFEHLADDYVEDGMQRFVDERYSRGLPCGGMIAYVLDNRVGAAFARIRVEIAARRVPLAMKARPLLITPSTALPACQHSADTTHRRSDGPFVLHHLLLGVTR